MEGDLRLLNELFRIINGALRLDAERVRNYSAFLADKLEEAGEASAAARLRKMLEESDRNLKPANVRQRPSLPVDGDSRFELLEELAPTTSRDFGLVLNDEQWKVIHEFLSVAKSYGQLEAEGVASSLSLMMCGPSGCGKSRIARHIAAELGLPMYLARLDGLISSFLGSTSKNIRAIFDYASARPCVLFLDELDAIAKLRGDSQELGELKRVVNSFLQNLDRVAHETIVLAATNHPELLDAAVWRRFSYRLEVVRPDQSARREMWSLFLGNRYFSSGDLDILADLSDGFSGSDVEEACLRLRRKEITSGEEPTLHDALVVLQNLALGDATRAPFLAQVGKADNREIASALRSRSEGRYSYASLGRLLGVSKATAQRLVAASTEGG